MAPYLPTTLPKLISCIVWGKMGGTYPKHSFPFDPSTQSAGGKVWEASGYWLFWSWNLKSFNGGGQWRKNKEETGISADKIGLEGFWRKMLEWRARDRVFLTIRRSLCSSTTTTTTTITPTKWQAIPWVSWGRGEETLLCSPDNQEGKGNGASIYYMWRDEGWTDGWDACWQGRSGWQWVSPLYPWKEVALGYMSKEGVGV